MPSNYKLAGHYIIPMTLYYSTLCDDSTYMYDI